MKARAITLTLSIASLGALAIPGAAHGVASISAGADFVAFAGDDNLPNSVIFGQQATGVAAVIKGLAQVGPGCNLTPSGPETTEVFCPGPITKVFAGGGAASDFIGGGSLSSVDLIANAKDGDDELLGGGGNDILLGGRGADKKTGFGGNDELREPDTAETPDDGGDVVSYAEKSQLVTVSITSSDAANDGVTGEQDRVDSTIEKVIGSPQDDVLGSAGGLHDRTSSLVGGNGDDFFFVATPSGGESGKVEVSYEDRDVRVNAKIGRPDGNGVTGENDDLGTTTNGLFVNRLKGGSAGDQLTGDGGNNTITGGPGKDDLFGEGGNDFFNQTKDAGGGADLISGGDGFDTVNFAGRPTEVHIDLSNNQPNDGEAGELADVEDDVEDAFGGAAGDTIIGNAAGNKLRGGPGSDGIFSGAGDDQIFGEEDSDVLDGGPGDDDVFGDQIADEPDTPPGEGDDQIDGGLGEDTLLGEGGNDTIVSRDGARDDIFCDPDNNESPFTTDVLFGDLRDVFKNTGCNKVNIEARDQGLGLQIVSRRIKIDRKGRAKIKVSCPESPVAKCVGDLTLSRLVISPGRPVGRVKLGFSYYRLKQGKKKTVTMKVKPKQRKAIRRAKGAKGEVLAEEPDVNGQPKTTIQPVEIKAAKVKSKGKRKKPRRRRGRR